MLSVAHTIYLATWLYASDPSKKENISILSQTDFTLIISIKQENIQQIRMTNIFSIFSKNSIYGPGTNECMDIFMAIIRA